MIASENFSSKKIPDRVNQFARDLQRYFVNPLSSPTFELLFVS